MLRILADFFHQAISGHGREAQYFTSFFANGGASGRFEGLQSSFATTYIVRFVFKVDHNASGWTVDRNFFFAAFLCFKPAEEAI
ncbi:MAG: hypothetical protein WBX25_34320 [Rhodomicrobium sp.]